MLESFNKVLETSYIQMDFYDPNDTKISFVNIDDNFIAGEYDDDNIVFDSLEDFEKFLKYKLKYECSRFELEFLLKDSIVTASFDSSEDCLIFHSYSESNPIVDTSLEKVFIKFAKSFKATLNIDINYIEVMKTSTSSEIRTLV